MYIIDKNGKQITITDLEAAITQAKTFMQYRHEQPGFTTLDNTLKAYWTDLYKKLCSLQEVWQEGKDTTGTYQTYRLKSNTGAPDVYITLEDLFPIPHTRKYKYGDLMKLTDDTWYKPDRNTPMGKEHGMLYELYPTYKGNFFIVRQAALVVVPGTFLYPTALTENRIREMDRK